MIAKEPISEASIPEAQQECGSHHERCPLCARENACRVANGHLYKGPCWCHQIIVPPHLLRRLAEDWLKPACLCRPCLETLARLAQERNDTEAILEEARAAIAANRLHAPGEPDFYLDEFGNTVFTAAYHLKRGNCCGNQCRHCPY